MTSHFRDGVQIAFDATTLKDVQACHRLYKYKFIDGYRRRGSNVHLEFGGFYASALEFYYKEKWKGLSHDEALIATVQYALTISWEYRYDEAGKIIPDSGAPWTSSGSNKTRDTLLRSIVWYLDQFGEDDQLKVITLANGKPAVELHFQLEVDNGVIFTGHLDKLVDYGGEPMITDQKTTESTVNPYYFDRYSPDTQMSMYAFAGKVAYHTPVKGVVVDAAQIAVGFTRFERGFIPQSSSMLNEWYEGVMTDISLIQQATRRAVENATIVEGKMVLDDKYFRMNPASCFNFGGCPFRGVCSKSPEVRKHWIKSDFEVKPLWNPLEPRI